MKYDCHIMTILYNNLVKSIYLFWQISAKTKRTTNNFDKSNNLSNIQLEDLLTGWQGKAMIWLASDKDTFDKEGVLKNDMLTYIQFPLKRISEQSKGVLLMERPPASEGQLLDH